MSLQDEINQLETTHSQLEQGIQEAVASGKSGPVLTVLQRNKQRTKEKLDTLKTQLANMG